MRKIQTFLLILTLFLCSNLTAQSQSDIDKRDRQKKAEQKVKPKIGVKSKIILDENGNRTALSKQNNAEKGKETPQIESKLIEDSNTKFAPATKTKEKNISKPGAVPVSINKQIKSLEERIAKIQNANIPNKEAELKKLKVALAKKKTQKAKSN